MHQTLFIRVPRLPQGVAILRGGGGGDDGRLADALATSGIGVVYVPAGAGIESGLAIADEHFPAYLPRLLAATGNQVRQARRDASAHGLAGSVLLNPTPRSGLRGRGTPAVIFADRSMLGARAWGRLASRLTAASYHVVDEDLAPTIGEWFTERGTVSRDSLISRRLAGALAAAVVVATPAALVGQGATASPGRVVATADPFDGGSDIDISQIQGDGQPGQFNRLTPEEQAAVRAAHAEANRDPKADKAPAGQDGVAVPTKAVAGDGTALVAPAATGSIALLSGNGVKYFINTDITFSTTSSASGAASEASFTTATTATTSAGGTVTTTLNDAFDGYNTLFVDAAGLGSSTNAYRPAAPPTAAALCSSMQYDFPAQTMQGLTVTRSVFVPDDGDYGRWLNTLTNPTGAPITVRVGTANNLGSDSNTRITGSTNGDTTADLTDTWIGTFQTYSGTTSSDPRLGHVLQGPGAPVPLAALSFVDGDDNPAWAWDVTIQPGETVRFMNFVAIESSKTAAHESAGDLASMATGPDGIASGLRCLDETAIGQLKNFAMPDVTVAGVTVSETAGVATVTFTRAASGAGATVTFTVTPGSATAGSDYTDPAPLTVTFAPGATTATVDIPLIDDADVESDETLTVAIAGVTGYGKAGAAASATVTIQSNDTPPETTTTVADTTTTAATTTTTIVIPGELPATGSSDSGPLTAAASLLAAAGAAMLGLVRRRRVQ